jgi:DNA-binding MarR family transcriptional regulator
MPTRKQLATGAWGALLRVHAAVVPVLDGAVQDATGLSLAWYDVLLELAAESGGRLRMSDLADRVTLSRTRVSRIVDELVAAGYVVKEGHPEDRRSTVAVLTAAGRTAFRRAAPVYVAAIERDFAAGLTIADLDQLAALLGRVLARQADARSLVT